MVEVYVPAHQNSPLPSRVFVTTQRRYSFLKAIVAVNQSPLACHMAPLIY